MEESLESLERFGYDFIPVAFLAPGEDEYQWRNRQHPARAWRSLSSEEVSLLEQNGCASPRWEDVLVCDPFDPSLVRNSRFYGLVRLGKLEARLLQHHDFKVPVGIYNSTLIAVDTGDHCCIQNCPYISHYILGDRVVLSRVDELEATNHAKFGNGVVTEGEDEAVRVWIDVMNEAGGRSILPFSDMIAADAYLWAAYRDDAALVSRLSEMTQRGYGHARGLYGTVGSRSVIKSVSIIKDVAVGESSYIKGANKLKNLTILSSREEPTQIGEGVELVNGIIGYGCRVFYGSKAVRFVMGRNSSLKYGARLIHSVLGDNSTVSCCEMLNNLIFPAHEQHHNNSFLIASLVQGLSNMAAGATVGSNHNSRAPDGELRAGRGFWPGLCVTLKHPSRFSSYVLVAKGDYPLELDVSLPFSLLSNDTSRDRRTLMGAWSWLYNLYALERNTWKTSSRDRRAVRVQTIEADYLAPDTVSEMLRALDLLAYWCATSRLRADGAAPDSRSALELLELGKLLLTCEEGRIDGLEVLADGVEKGRPVLILKPRQSYHAYRQMLRYAAARALLALCEAVPSCSFTALRSLAEPRLGELSAAWVNLGGQIVRADRVDALRTSIGEESIRSWEEIHGEYRRMDDHRREDAGRQAWAVLEMLGGKALDREGLLGALDEALETRRWVEAQIRAAREKDYNDRFRAITYRNRAEMEAVLGKIEGNPFIALAREETEHFVRRVEAMKERFAAEAHG